MTLELPAALAPWAEQLAMLPEDIALALGPLVARLAAALGPFQLAGRAAAETASGFAGIARRGSYERLLISEWLLADEVPDEFVRRAACSEHMFLELDRRSPAGGAVSFALFDTGPSQLGAPRLAQLALLVALARRAAAARASFRWGVLQWQGSPVLSEVTPATVRELLGARTTRSPSAPMLERWKERLDDIARGDRREVWLIGGERATRLSLPRGARTIAVQDRIEPEARALSVTIEDRSSGRPRTVDLELPPAPLVARLLRDPFTTYSAPKTISRFALTQALPSIVVSRGGRKAFMRSGRGLAVFSIPNSARAGHGRPKQIDPRGTVAAVSVSMGKLLLLVSDATTRTLSLRHRDAERHVGHFTTERRVHAPWMPLPTDPLSSLFVRRAAQQPSALFLDSRQWLFAFEAAEGGSRLVARDVLAATSLHTGVAFIARDVPFRRSPGGKNAAALGVLSYDGTRDVTDLHEEVVDARLAAGARGPVFATRSERGDWSLKCDHSATSVAAAQVEGDRVVTVLQPPGGAPGLVTITGDLHSCALVQQGATERLFRSTKRIVHASVDDYGRVLATIDENNEIVFTSLLRKEIVARIDASRGST